MWVINKVVPMYSINKLLHTQENEFVVGILVYGCYFDALVCPRPNEQFLVLGGEGGVRTLARLACALFSSTWQCQKTSKQGFPFTNLRIEYLMHKLIAGRIQTFFLISYVMATIKKEK